MQKFFPTQCGGRCRKVGGVATWFLASVAILAGGNETHATVISATDNFLIEEIASINNTGDATTPVLFIGSNNVVPNANNGTTGTATSSDGSITNYSLLNTSSTAFPNQISTGIGGHAIPFDGSNPNLLDPWTLTFSNPGFTPVTVQTPSSAGFSLPAFASNVTITGGTTTPTISYTGTANGASINIVNLNQCGDGTAPSGGSCNGHGGFNTIFSRGGLSPSGTFQVPTSAGLTVNGTYQIQVLESVTHDGTTNTQHQNEAAISRALFVYSVSPNVPQVPINVPMVDSAGTFHFNLTVTGGTAYYLDPSIATGYIFQIGAGDPLFASVTLPVLPSQTDKYEISWDNGLDTAFVSEGQMFDFPGLGVSEFEVLGIDLANDLDPNNPTAFAAQVTFESSGQFTGTMTPITTQVPEPASLPLLAGVLAFFWAARVRGIRSFDS
jgi:hypothetical protein